MSFKVAAIHTGMEIKPDSNLEYIAYNHRRSFNKKRQNIHFFTHDDVTTFIKLTAHQIYFHI